MAISPARRIAYDILARVETRGAYASDLLHAELGPKVKTEDAGLATELTLGVLRRQSVLDFLIERYSRKRLGTLDREVVLAMRMGLYQLRFLERVPARAAVHESVELVKQARKSSAASFVNAVLRRAADDSRAPVEQMLPATLPETERLSILDSHPAWLVTRWLGTFGRKRTIALLDSNNRAPEISAAFHTASDAECGAISKSLAHAGMSVEPGRWLRNAARLSGGSPTNSGAYRDGSISIQDEASQMVPILLDVRRGDSVLDLCAAPGGKTAALVRAAGSVGKVIAADRHSHRLAAMRAQMARLGLKNVQLVELDGTKPLPFAQGFQRILVDAPCSGTGTLARHPEIRWRLKPEDLGELHERQAALLRSALEKLEKGGRLVYSTCSLEAEENEQVVEEALSDYPGVHRVGRREMKRALGSHLREVANVDALLYDDDTFRTFPPEHSTDGFFAAAMEKGTA